MPHIIVEHTKVPNLNLKGLLQDLHANLASQETVNMGAIKTRSIPIENAILGEDTQGNAFIHITLKLLSGRSDELRKTMAEGLFSVAKAHASDNPDVSISVETAELHNASYIK